MNSDIMNSEMMIKLALKLGELTGDGTITWKKNRDVIRDDYWSSEHEGKCFRIYESKSSWSISPPKWLDVEVRLELWDAERENCEAEFPNNRAFGDLLNFIRNQEIFSPSTEQYVHKLVNAAS